MLTIAKLMNSLDYSPDTGEFHWKFKANRHVNKGDVAGSLHSGRGYRDIKIGGSMYRAHRLAWFLCNGEWPIGQVDHIDGNRDNNAISNLRVATNAENAQNRKAAAVSKSGLVGATWYRRTNKWASEIAVNQKRRHLGYFATAAEAHEAYKAAKRELHTFAPELRS